MEPAFTVRRLGIADVDLALRALRLMADVLSEGSGDVTAHVLPMTRSESTELFIYDLAVDPAHQRRGIGRALVETLQRDAAAEGTRVAFVPADDEDAHALAFYHAMGGEAAAVTIFSFETA